MATITRTYNSTSDVVTGATILAAHINTDLDKVYSEINGNLDNDNIKSSAAIAISKTALGTYTAWTDYTPTFYKNDNTTTFTFTTTKYRYMQVGKLVSVAFYFETASVSPGVDMYMTSPINPSSTLYGASDTHLGTCKMVGSSMDATTGTIGFVSWNTASNRIRLNTFTAITLGTVLACTGTFSYEVA